MPRALLTYLTLLLLVASFGCAAAQKPDSREGSGTAELFEGGSCDDILSLEQRDPFLQVSWMMTDADISEAEYRVPAGDSNGWTDWEPAEITFEEGTSYNARIILSAPTERIELRGGENLHRAHFSFGSRVTARRPAQHNSLCSSEDRHPWCVNSESPAGAAPEDLVTRRRDWGAIDPERICRDAAMPTRVSFHHTFMPGDDGDDPARSIRQIQAFHINERGWCDVGYHFLIAKNGEIFRGRGGANRPGAHVRGQNRGNIGVGFIGDFTAEPPTTEQVESAVRLTRWIHTAFDIPLTRDAIRGHHEWPGQSTGCPGELMNGDVDRIAQIVEGAGLELPVRIENRN